MPKFEGTETRPTEMLLVGFRRDLDDMINEIDKWVAPGSKLTLLARMETEERMQILQDGGLSTTFANMLLVNAVGNPVLQRHLDERVDIPSFDSIIVLTESLDENGEPLTPLNCDSRTLVTTLLIRDIQKKNNVKKTLVCEILDPRTENLLKLAELDDFLSANDLVSMALAQAILMMCCMVVRHLVLTDVGQVAKESDIHGLLADIFCPEGDEMHIKDIRYYAQEGEHLSWWEITARARMRGEVALGFTKPEFGGVPILNPGNSAQADVFTDGKVPYTKKTRLTWKYGDKLIVFSMD